MNRLSCWSTCLAFLILASRSSSALLSSKECTDDCPLLVHAYASSPIYTDIDSFTITTSITNLSPHTIKLLDDPRTVISSWATQSFKITKGTHRTYHSSSLSSPGISPLFRGVAVRFLPSSVLHSVNCPTVILAPRETVEVVHEVGKYYDFSQSGPGEYTFAPSDRFFKVVAPGFTAEPLRAKVIPALVFLPAGELRSYKPLSAWSLGGPRLSLPFLRDASTPFTKLDASESDAAPPPNQLDSRAAPSRPIPPSYATSSPNVNANANAGSSTTCSPSQLMQIKSAMRAGADLARKSADHLKVHRKGSDLQTTWYGSFSSDAHKNTLTAFNTLRDLFSVALSSSNFGGGKGPGPEFDCTTCTSPHTYAYVYPSQFPKIFICGLFWDSPATGPGSRADTLIHEGTHFDEVLGTRDTVYGEERCIDLARTDPGEAVWNADNHAFFSVNV
ncbi:hypothetical protein BDV98DRAFT_564469 [Pterulicium gracile]|uniref:Lysine-specific metallo-endopeptidase domain-containing protein n=1 Tax=Pterulicium gracile TaxID=1884261 RepID=A0A5C3QTI8_9AGAR|nr:hypothetical protein BDV98DRAFT_564469 [Pterula gracilis]